MTTKKTTDLPEKDNPLLADTLTGLDSEDTNLSTKDKVFTIESIGDTIFPDKTTDDLAEGVTNLYASETNLGNSTIIQDLQTNKQDISNLSTDMQVDTGSNTKYPSVAAVQDEIDNYSLPDATTISFGKVKLATESEATDGTSTTAVVTADYLGTLGCIASDNVRVSADTEVVTPDIINSATKFKEIEITDIPKGGTIRVTFDGRREESSSGASGSGVFQLRVNGTTIEEDQSASTSYISYSHDLTIENGDLVQLYLYHTSGGFDVYAQNFRISYDGVFSPRTTVNLD